jgi:aminoglycoside 3-N-acetyltransferase
VGAEVEALLGSHQRDKTPCGANSPFRKLWECGGQILFLGCGLRPNTSMHGVEELEEPPYLFGDKVSYRAILPDGSEIEGRTRRHDFSGWSQRYDRIGPLLSDGGLSEGKILEATVHVLECRAMWERAHEALRRDPFTFVERRRGT